MGAPRMAAKTHDQQAGHAVTGFDTHAKPDGMTIGEISAAAARKRRWTLYHPATDGAILEQAWPLNSRAMNRRGAVWTVPPWMWTAR